MPQVQCFATAAQLQAVVQRVVRCDTQAINHRAGRARQRGADVGIPVKGR